MEAAGNISWAAGWLLGEKESGGRQTMTTLLCNISVGLVVATSSFAGTPTVTVVVAYRLDLLLGTLALAVFMGNYKPSQTNTVQLAAN